MFMPTPDLAADKLGRKSVVESMCFTFRHDFGLDRLNDNPHACGMNDIERQGLRNVIGQLYDHHVVAAIAAEREACLAIVESHGKDHLKVKFISDEIRARSEKAPASA